MPDDLFAPRRDAEQRTRAALIKSRFTVAEAALALGEVDARGRACCPAAAHGATGSDPVTLTPDGRGFVCGGCGAQGDVISFVRLSAGLEGFGKACDWLEHRAQAPRDDATGDLFRRQTKTGAA